MSPTRLQLRPPPPSWPSPSRKIHRGSELRGTCNGKDEGPVHSGIARSRALSLSAAGADPLGTCDGGDEGHAHLGADDGFASTVVPWFCATSARTSAMGSPPSSCATSDRTPAMGSPPCFCTIPLGSFTPAAWAWTAGSPPLSAAPRTTSPRARESPSASHLRSCLRQGSCTPTAWAVPARFRTSPPSLRPTTVPATAERGPEAHAMGGMRATPSRSRHPPARQRRRTA